MTNPDPKLIEPPVRLSQSKLWLIQENYFNQMGIDAWKEEVPFYISSNAFIGWRYAQLIYHFLQDLNPQDLAKPFYLLELGCGTGKFSFYFLKALNLLLQETGSPIQFVYILSDISEANLKFCSQNPCFKIFIEANQIDFAQLNVETSTDFYLKNAQKQFSQIQNVHPLIVIANYTFDCVKQDAFECHKGKAKEIRLGLHSRYKNFNIEKARHLNDLRFNYEYLDIDPHHYYPENELNQILIDYTQQFNEKPGFVMMPLSAFKFIDHCHALSERLFIIIGDKGIAQSQTFSDVTENARVTYDGCYSFLLNFDALGQYVKNRNGDCLLTKNSNDFKVCAYSVGFDLKTYYQTQNYYKNDLDTFGPHEYCYIYDEFLASSYRFGVRGLISFIRMSQYDPHAYGAVHDRLVELIPVFDHQNKRDLERVLQKVIDRIYHLPIGDNILNNMGVLYLKMGDEDKALALFLKSIEIFNEKSTAYLNAARIYEKQKNIPKALSFYEKAFEYNKRDEYANRKIHALSNRFYMRSLIPIFKGIFVFSIIILLMYLIGR